MPSICEICLIEGITEGANVYEDGEKLRAHLIEYHSKFVAKALLVPKISDKIHIWLLANIDYSSNTEQFNDEHKNEEDFYIKEEPSTSTTSNSINLRIQNADPQEEQNEDNYSGKNELDNQALENLLKGLLDQANNEEEGHQMHKGDQPTNSGTLASEENIDGELDFFAPLKSLLLSTASDKEKPDGESFPLRAALVDSKAVRKAHCQICNLDICSTARQRHVYMIHLKKKDLFKCKLCDYANSNSMWEVQKHCRMQHGSDIRPISQEEKHRFEIHMWSQLCFPEWKQKPQKRKLEDSDGMKEDLNEQEKRHNKFADYERRDSEETEEPNGNIGDDPEMMDEQEATELNDRLCHLCMEESKYPGRHIAQRHLKQSLYECPICKFGSYESCTVGKHIQKLHPKEASKISPISNLAKYADEIREFQARCFPNRQMKLVRSVKNSGRNRPRERHQCGICGADVAQSDRQRHVFHKHFPPTKIFECPLCPFSSNYDVHRVKWHIKWDHKDYKNNNGTVLEPISHESKYREKIDMLNEKCFPGWQRKRHISTHDDRETPEEIGKIDPDLMEKALKTVAEAINHQNEQQHRQNGSKSPEADMDDIEDSNSNTLEWTCQLCFVALKPGTNLLRHVAKDHLCWKLYQCPICMNHGAQSAYEVRSHMLRTHGETSQELQSNLEENFEEIEKVWKECFPHKEFKTGGEKMVETTQKFVTDETRVSCRECGQEMKTEDRQIHVYRHHLREPRLYECPACDFSHYACSSDVRNHIIRAHKDQLDLMPRNNLLRFSKEISDWNEKCFPGWINRRLPASAIEDFNNCRLCGMEVRQTSRHISEHHLGIPLHQCPLCEYGAAEARLVLRHMRNNHTTGECEGLEPISNVEKRRADFSELHSRCFPGRPKRLSNITISDESRRAKCRSCGMTISKKKRLMHLLEKHLKKSTYKCKYCLFSSTHERSTVEAHQKEKHAGKMPQVISTIQRHKGELQRLAIECFHEPNLKLED